ncbi:hypothetical protein PHPALM_31773 [Phytophthora palmivora]|uniref:Uncharacterized protein n=1 Tax=Phytophthora palmivora TaxID=4796 RepID=A0A2P4X1T5_9STRA|nr:hypothetical protein PHPALM_31773 [Phytophthora palmivora]
MVEGEDEEGVGDESGDEEDQGEDEGQTMKAHLSCDDYQIIVSWMRVPENVSAIHGSSEKTKVGEKCKVKKWTHSMHFQSDTETGLSKREQACRISFQQKLAHKCPHFSRMRALFEMKANVTPSTTVDLGLPSLSTCSNVTSDNYQGTENGYDYAICSVVNNCWVNEELTVISPNWSHHQHQPS